MATAEVQVWRFRRQGEDGPGRAVSQEKLFEAIAQGALEYADEVCGPNESCWLAVDDHPNTSEHLTPRPVLPPQESEEGETDMTPMIDVIFQLIIFFMIAATFTVQKVMDMPNAEEDLEQTATTIQELEDDHVLVKITEDGQIHIQSEPVEQADLEARLSEVASQKKSAELIMDVDDNAVHDLVVQVLDAARGANIEKVLFVSRVASE